MENNKKTANTIIVTLLIVLIVLAAFLFIDGPKAGAPLDTAQIPAAQMSGDTANMVSLSIAPGAVLAGATTITGTIRGAYFFEANARGMLLDASKNVLKTFPITATTDWMTSDAVSFTTIADATGIAPGSGYFRIANDNPSGDPVNDKYIDVPVVFQ